MASYATTRSVVRSNVPPPIGAWFVRPGSAPDAKVSGSSLRRYLGAMAVRLHRCPNVWVKLSGHPCWRVQKALDEAGIEYEIVKGPLRPGKRDDIERLSGQRKYPVIEFDDGSVYREESSEMAATIREGRLDEKH
jgi:glutaredoxin